MRSLRASLLALALVLASSASVWADRDLSIRLVEAVPSDSGNPAGLQDIIPVLRKTLPGSAYRMVSSATIPLPSQGTAATLDEYEVRCSGSQKKLEIEVLRGGRETLRTSVVLQRKRPLIVAGLLGTDRSLLLVFLVK